MLVPTPAVNFEHPLTVVEHVLAKRDEQHRDKVREEVNLQWIGTGLFLLGAIAGGLAKATC